MVIDCAARKSNSLIEGSSYFRNVGLPANAVDLLLSGTQDEFDFRKGPTQINRFYRAIESALNNSLKPFSTPSLCLIVLDKHNLLRIDRAGGAVGQKRVNADNLVGFGPKFPIPKKLWRTSCEFLKSFWTRAISRRCRSVAADYCTYAFTKAAQPR